MEGVRVRSASFAAINAKMLIGNSRAGSNFYKKSPESFNRYLTKEVVE